MTSTATVQKEAVRRDENIALLRQYHTEEDAREKAAVLARIVEYNSALVRAVAGRSRERIRGHSGIEMEDLYQIGTIGVYRFIRFIVRLLCWLDHKEDPYDYEDEYMD